MTQIYFGVVESRTDDPLKMGRVKVRVLGVHTEDKVELPTNDLPWAMIMTPITSASMNGIGDAPVGVVEGTYVAILFLDGDDKQKPLVIGTLPGFPIAPSTGKGFEDPNKQFPRDVYLNEPDANRLARNQRINDTIVKTKEDAQLTDMMFAISKPGVWKQPTIPYSARYPFNHVFESESGNIQEIDDTPKAERYHNYHRSGTFTEIDANGTQVNRIVGNGYQIFERDGYVHVSGSCVVHISGDANVKVGNSAFVEVGGSVNLVANDNINMASKKTVTIQAQDDIQLFCKDFVVQTNSVNMNIKKGIDILAGENIDINGKNTYIQSKTAAPKAGNFGTWARFDPETLITLPEPPSRESEQILAVEGYTRDELISVGLDPDDAKFATPRDISTGHLTIPLSITPISVTGISEIPVTVPIGDCGNRNTIISSYHKISDILFPASGGSIQAQHGKTVCQIVTNMKKVGSNVINPIFDTFGGSNCSLTSFYRRAGNPYSMPGKISKHEFGLACDIQFNDISGFNSYQARALIIKDLIFAELILVEMNAKGSVWIHIQLPLSASS